MTGRCRLDSVKLAAVQYRPPWGHPERAREALCALVAQAADQGADLIVCPEMAITGYVFRSPDEIRSLCEPTDGPTFQALSALARKRGAWVVCGFAEAGADGALYNSALVIDGEGALVCCYRKVLLFELDTLWAQPGSERPVVESPAGLLAPSICMDLNDPWHTLHLIRAAPDVVAFCTNWVDEGEDILPYWRDRLWPWRGWFVAADRWGFERGVRFYGRSAILRPGGEVAAMAPAEGDGVLVVDMADAGS